MTTIEQTIRAGEDRQEREAELVATVAELDALDERRAICISKRDALVAVLHAPPYDIGLRRLGALARMSFQGIHHIVKRDAPVV